jgi:hypothetical protein
VKHKFEYGQLDIVGEVGGRWNVYHKGKQINPSTFTNTGFFSRDEALAWAVLECPELLDKLPVESTINKDTTVNDAFMKYFTGRVP